LAEPSSDLPPPGGAERPPSGLTRLSQRVRRIIAPNPSPFTFTGTCVYIVGEGEVAVIDPGPADPAHLEAVIQAIPGERIAMIVVTHSHRDHAAGAAALKRMTGAPIVGARAHAVAGAPQTRADASHALDYAPDQALVDGARVAGRGFTLEAIATPGHAANHLAFALVEESALFSGDHVMGWSTSVIAPPDGSMRDYLASLEKVARRSEAIYWPGHGAPVAEPQRYARALISHRRQREAAILAEVEAGEASLGAIVARVYPRLAPALIGAASLSTLAHLEHLAERGLVVGDRRAGLEARFRRL